MDNGMTINQNEMEIVENLALTFTWQAVLYYKRKQNPKNPIPTTTPTEKPSLFTINVMFSGRTCVLFFCWCRQCDKYDNNTQLILLIIIMAGKYVTNDMKKV